MDILKKADKIVNERSEDQKRKHGPAVLGMYTTAKLASNMTGKDLTASDVTKVLIALKLSRIKLGEYHEDHYVDAAGYIEILSKIESNENIGLE